MRSLIGISVLLFFIGCSIIPDDTGADFPKKSVIVGFKYEFPSFNAAVGDVKFENSIYTVDWVSFEGNAFKDIQNPLVTEIVLSDELIQTISHFDDLGNLLQKFTIEYENGDISRMEIFTADKETITDIFNWSDEGKLLTVNRTRESISGQIELGLLSRPIFTASQFDNILILTQPYNPNFPIYGDQDFIASPDNPNTGKSVFSIDTSPSYSFYDDSFYSDIQFIPLEGETQDFFSKANMSWQAEASLNLDPFTSEVNNFNILKIHYNDGQGGLNEKYVNHFLIVPNKYFREGKIWNAYNILYSELVDGENLYAGWGDIFEAGSHYQYVRNYVEN